MIYVCTLNPSLDYKIELDKVQMGQLNRTEKTSIAIGGKGINISLMLSDLKIIHTCLGFLGGIPGEHIRNAFIENTLVKSLWTHIEQSNRINIKLKESRKETEINAYGPMLTTEEITRFFSVFNNMNDEDIFILSGSIHPSHTSIYAKIAEVCFKKKVRLVLDIPGEYYDLILPFRPWMVKPNLNEFNAYMKQEKTTKKEQILGIKQLLTCGVSHVVLSLGKKGSFYGTSEGITLVSIKDPVNLLSTGAGDAMIAGFLYAFSSQKNHRDTHQYMTMCAYQKITSNKEIFVDVDIRQV